MTKCKKGWKRDKGTNACIPMKGTHYGWYCWVDNKFMFSTTEVEKDIWHDAEHQSVIVKDGKVIWDVDRMR